MTEDDVDRDHLRRMLEVVSAMRRGEMTLVQGADSLLFLRSALEAASEGWSDDITNHIATLESAGLATGNQVAEMGDGYGTVIEQALAAIEELVRHRTST